MHWQPLNEAIRFEQGLRMTLVSLWTSISTKFSKVASF